MGGALSDETPKTALLQTITGVMPSLFKIFEVDKERALKGNAANVSVVVSVLVFKQNKCV